jgi:uncharacterized membrane protein YheB (UPF0754 family)
MEKKYFLLNKDSLEIKKRLGIIKSFFILKYISAAPNWSAESVLVMKEFKDIECHESIQAVNPDAIDTIIKSRVLIQGEYINEVTVWKEFVFLYAENDNSLIQGKHHNELIDFEKSDEFKNYVRDYINDGWKKIEDGPPYDFNHAQTYVVIKKEEPSL